ncbi:phospholipase D [Athelia psychrophila]|uniref:Phospholipase n=1 Tax=Athelia psychrophila TaxID=1759441 RepID=A0A166UA90_9AGAM|nr:phospholipase D [Fibularhizoctonia sp. CBS 109695]
MDGAEQAKEKEDEDEKSKEKSLQRSQSLPHSKDKTSRGPTKQWGRLKSLLPQIAGQSKATGARGQTAINPQDVNIADELMIGGLSTVMLRLWFERDEKDRRRIPILFHRLRIRISDSLHPMQGKKSVFRIECEYANGAARWVVYRQLRDFISMHAHYTISNAYNRNIEAMPEFPRTSLPYFKFLKREGDEVGQADFALLQREAMENYLIGLIRAVMFHPTANRLAGFLEISALSISLAQTGGSQAKAGYLRIDASGSKGGGFGRKSARWAERKQSRWCAVRESYLVVLNEPGELTVWDVFLFDPDFKIERPTRYYRQGFNLLHPDSQNKEIAGAKGEPKAGGQHSRHSGAASTMGTITSRMSKLLHLKGHNGGHSDTALDNGGRLRAGSMSSASSNASSDGPEPLPTPMLDPSTNINPLEVPNDMTRMRSHVGGEDDKKKKKKRTGDVSKHTFYIENSQMRLKLFARNERQMLQWITALEKVAASSHYTGSNRFDSFAPIRMNVAAQWLVDGRDYFWNVSRAILLAKDTIYIHDWWLSPELQLRRPNKDKYRLDRLLQRKAREGVKIYVIVYQEVSSRTTPTDSNYTKQRLTALHENIMVQRSPSHFQTGTFYWAHHEKMCVIDQTIAFMGGLDLCFGRWDTPQHIISDDTEVGPETSEIWPGKDYSNPRILDFHTLNKPDEDLYDRAKIPRMPWHDVSMQVVGQPARDLCRHFVQRWNYLLRIKNHTKLMPFLLPPPEFKPGELTGMGLTGTCEMQICRSAGPWSMGTPSRIEHSIQNAYLKAIQMSDHFVYIENQFFITSTFVNEVKIENRIGDALVARIIRAHREKTPWKCCIVIPLLPGFSFPVDHADASAVRIILECQNRTIGRGPNSIFSRIRKEGADPADYIAIFSLRNWAKMRGDVLTTEQVYIHGKICIVDDRLAIIGSANINERSQRGDRDSELAAVIRDTDMIDGSMAGKPYKVGRFAHSLRVRLMREHIGVDVDAVPEADLMASEPVKPDYEQEEWDPDAEQEHGQEGGITRVKKSQQRTPASAILHTVVDGAEQALHGTGEANSKSAGKLLRKVGLKTSGADATAGDEALSEERQTYTRKGEKVEGFADSVVPTLEEKVVEEQRPPPQEATGNEKPPSASNTGQPSKASLSEQAHVDGGELYGAPADASKSAAQDDEPPHARSGIDDADEQEAGAPSARASIRKNLASKTWTLLQPTPQIDPDGFEDPICDEFWKNVWVAAAVHNTEIYRKVFHAVPDDLVTTWKQYKEFVSYHDRLNQPVKGQGGTEPLARVPSETADDNVPGKQNSPTKPESGPNEPSVHTQDPSENQPDGQSNSNGQGTPPKNASERKPASRGVAEPFDASEREEMEKLLGELCGHLVVYPNRFLEGEDIANNFLFNADRLMPLPIYA